MKELKIYCDHCGKLITKTNNSKFKITRGDCLEMADLCDECYEQLAYIVQQFCIGESGVE